MKTKLLLYLIVFFSMFTKAQNFVHPGLNHKKSDLERMKLQIEAGIEPWASSYKSLAADIFSQHTYIVKGNTSMTVLARDSNSGPNKAAYEDDMTAAYQNALMWWMTNDQKHADKAIEILNAWVNLKSIPGIPLDVGLYVAPMVNAAELIKHSNAGWAEADMQKFSDMLVYPGYSNTTVPEGAFNDNHTFYWGIYNGDPKRAGNQELAAYKGMMSMGIFLDNELMYQRALRYLSDQDHHPDDLPYEAGPKTTTSIISDNGFLINYNWSQQFTIPDYGYDGVITNYIYDNGQSQESSRDQTHAMYGVSLTAQIAEIAWNQGDDLYSLADNRILLGLEYHLRYNLTYENEYDGVLEPWEPTVENGLFYQKLHRTARGKSLKINPYSGSDNTRVLRGLNITRPYWETPLNHYKDRLNLDPEKYKWLQRGRDLNIEKTGDYEVRSESRTDTPGWGAFTHSRTSNCPGDPINGFDTDGLPNYNMNTLPMTIEAENFDYFPIIGQGRTYNDISSSNTGGVYRTDENVDLKESLEGGYSITNIENGEWLTYTVNVPANGTYDISIRYAAANGNGKIKFNFGGEDVTTDVNVPFGSTNSTSLTDWKDFTVATNVSLTKGVQALKVLFSGANNSFELSNMNIEINTLSCIDSVDTDLNYAQGVNYKYYEGTWSELPDFTLETVVKTGEISTIGLSEATSTDNYGFVFDGYVYAAKDGMYTFYTNSDDGSRLSIAGVSILNNDGLQEASANICLNEGYHKISVEYFTASGVNSSLSVLYEGPSISKKILPIYLEEAKVAGQFEFLFETNNNFEGWSSFNNPGTTSMSVTSGALQATYAATAGYLGIQYPADLEFSSAHPYVAIKIDHLPAGRMAFYMANGWYNNDKEGFSSLANTTLNNSGIYVYDLSANGPGFGSSAKKIFTDNENYTDTNRIIFLIDENDTSSTSNSTYNDIEWIKNFASIQDIIDYAGVTLAVNDVQKEVISMYPNPVKSSFTITNHLGANVEIFDMVGRLILKSSIKSNKQSIDINHFKKGMYLIRVNSNGSILSKKILKM